MIECSASHRRVIRGASYVCADCGEDLGSLRKVADKFNDFLMNPKARPDLQTPEAQEFLQNLQQDYLTPRTDALMPWVTREWKKGRITGPGIQIRRPEPANGDYGYEGAGPYILPDGLNHWADWYHSTHPTRTGVDIMSLKAHEMSDKINEYDEAMKAQSGGAAGERGEVVHQYPDNWSIQNLNTEKLLKDEGDTMGHCVGGGGYWPYVNDGRTLIYSLRDHKNEPHATMEITPHAWECNSCGEDSRGRLRPVPGMNCRECDSGQIYPVPQHGEMVQIQGKANEAPKPEYQQRIKDYFDTMNPESRPRWEDQRYDSASDFDTSFDEDDYRTYHPGDYGLSEPGIEYNWPEIVADHADDVVNQYGYDKYDRTNAIAAQADRTGELESLRSAVEDWGTSAQEGYEKAKRDEWDADPEGTAQERGIADESLNGPPPDEYDFWSEDPETFEKEFDDAAYQDAYEKWEHHRKAELEAMRDEYIQGEWWDSDHNNLIHDWDTALYRPQRAAHALPCEVCGDPLEADGKCKRCDWGTWSDAMGTENPSDVTRDVKPGIQASARGSDRLWQPVPSSQPSRS